MRIAQFTPALVLALVATLLAQSTEKKTTVTGKLTRVMAIGAESTGWSVEFDSATIIEGKPLHSIQIRYGKTARLEKLANKQVRAIGILSHRHGVETGDHPVLDVSPSRRSRLRRIQPPPWYSPAASGSSKILPVPGSSTTFRPPSRSRNPERRRATAPAIVSSDRSRSTATSYTSEPLLPQEWLARKP
jgi:hypothetical protein